MAKLDSFQDRIDSTNPYGITVISSETEEDRGKLRQSLQELVDRNDHEFWPRALQNFQNVAFVLGNHFTLLNWNGSVLSATSPSTTDGLARNPALHVPKTVANHMIRPYEATISLFNEIKPYPKVSARSDDPQDEDAADLAEVVVDVVWENIKMPQKLRQLVGEFTLCGTSALEISFDENEAFQLPKPPEQEVGVDEIIEKDTMEPVKQLRVTVWSAFQIIPDPHATADPDSWSFIGTQSFVDRDWVMEAYNREEPGYYPEHLEGMTRGEGAQCPLAWHEKIRGLLDIPSEMIPQVTTRYGGDTQNPVSPNDILLRVFDVKPNKLFPKGRTIVFAGGQLIYCSPKDVGSRAWSEKYPERWTNIVPFSYWQIPGRFWGTALLSEIVPMQRRINAIDALVMANRGFMALGTMLVPNTARLPDNFIGSAPGQIINYKVSTSQAKPEMLQHQALPPELLTERALLVEEIQRISGVNDMLTGNAPSQANMRSNEMLETIRKAALQSKGSIFSAFEEALQVFARNMLIEISENLTDTDHPLSQQIAMAARNHSSMAIDRFVGAQLRDNVQVKFDIASALLKSPEQKAQKAQELLQYGGQLGLIGPQEFRTIAKAMGVEELLSGTNLDVQHVRRLVAMVKYGFKGAVDTIIEGAEDPGIAAQVVRAEIMRPSFYDQPPDVQQEIMDLFETYQLMQSKRMAEISEIRMATGTDAEGKPEEGGSSPAGQKPKAQPKPPGASSGQ